MKLKDWRNHNRDLFTPSQMRYLCKHLLEKNVHALYTDTCCLSEQERYTLTEVARQYGKGTPFAYCLGKEEFFGMDFYIEPGVFIPRAETEVIVEKALSLIHQERCIRILDMCCGSGCIGIAIKEKSTHNVIVTACDISFTALTIAKKNALRHSLPITLVNSNLFSAFRTCSFDMIVANPPYVETHLITGSLLHEPRQALDGGASGIVFIRHILESAHLYLKRGGCCILEMGFNQKDTVDRLLSESNAYKRLEWIKDYSGNWRGVILRKTI